MPERHLWDPHGTLETPGTKPRPQRRSPGVRDPPKSPGPPRRPLSHGVPPSPSSPRAGIWGALGRGGSGAAAASGARGGRERVRGGGAGQRDPRPGPAHPPHPRARPRLGGRARARELLETPEGLLALGGALGGALALGVPLPPLCPLLPPLAAAASSVAFGLGLFLLARRRLRGGGNGHPVYEFFVGGELGSPLEPPENLHWERVGLYAWVLVLAAALGEQQRLWGSPSLPLTLVAAAQGVSVLRRLRELSGTSPPGPGGFLGVFGALAWDPFGGPLPALLLLQRPQNRLGGAGGAACGGLYALGLWIFHGATTQRSLFSRDPRDPRVAGLPTVPTATGQVLLAGGWWGLVRRPDDLGELLMALGWTLPCGLSPALLLLLVGAALRELRALVGERRQRRRFGGAWGGLCQRVPHRLLPLVY